MNFIVHPLTKTRHSLSSKDGKNILKNILNIYKQVGSCI